VVVAACCSEQRARTKKAFAPQPHSSAVIIGYLFACGGHQFRPLDDPPRVELVLHDQRLLADAVPPLRPLLVEDLLVPLQPGLQPLLLVLLLLLLLFSLLFLGRLGGQPLLTLGFQPGEGG